MSGCWPTTPSVATSVGTSTPLMAALAGFSRVAVVMSVSFPVERCADEPSSDGSSPSRARFHRNFAQCFNGFDGQGGRNAESAATGRGASFLISRRGHRRSPRHRPPLAAPSGGVVDVADAAHRADHLGLLRVHFDLL